MLKRLALAFVFVLAAAVPSWAAWGTPTVTTSCASGCDTTDDFATNATMTVGVTVASGDFVVVVVHHYRPTARTVSSIQCTAGGSSDTAAEAHAQANATLGGRNDIYFYRATGACTTITVTMSGTSAAGGDQVVALVATGSANPGAETGTSAGANTSASPHDSGTVTPAVSEVLFIGSAQCSNGSYTNDADFTSAKATSGGIVAYRIQSTSTAQSFTITSVAAEDCAIALAAFEGAATASGSGLPPSSLSLLGVGGI